MIKARDVLIGSLVLILMSKKVEAQDLTPGSKMWYSNYTYFKLNSRFYLDNYLVTSFDLKEGHPFGFVQTDLALNYKLSKKLRFLVAYSNAQFRYRDSYEERYDKEPNALNAFSVHRLGVGAQYRLKLTRTFRFNQKLVTQYYVPQLEKFRWRVVYSGKLEYKHRKAPLQMVPYVQYFLYYYAGGKEFELSEDLDEPDDEPQFTDPANGFHRYRLRAGLRFKPLPSCDPLSLTLYYAMQREFNLDGFGGELNIPVEGRRRPLLPFNNFNIIGLQANLVFN
ncbi:MAG: hypothetical protein JJ975_03480 [Bacteroidia bacterium]|nr:hypothetical protein [Bacteroidia bacterium]